MPETETEKQTESNALVAVDQVNTIEKFTNKDVIETIIEAHRKELESFVPDVSTAKGRKEIASFAHKFRKSKTAFEDAGKKLTAEAKQQIDAVNAERRKVRDAFDEMAAEARKPLDIWENQEKERINELKGWIKHISDYADSEITLGFNSEQIKANLDNLKEYKVDSAFEEFENEAHRVKAEAVAKLEKLLEDTVKKEKEAAELERLRKEKAEREEKERKEAEEKRQAEEKARIEAEAKEKAEKEAKEREEKLKAEKYEAEKAAKKAKEETERKRIERIRHYIDEIKSSVNVGERSADSIQDRIFDVKKVEIDDSFGEFAEEARTAQEMAIASLEKSLQAASQRQEEQEAEAKKKAEAEARAKVEAEERAKAQEEFKRKEDENHRIKVHHQAVCAISDAIQNAVTHGRDNGLEMAEDVLAEIEAGNVPNVSINY